MSFSIRRGHAFGQEFSRFTNGKEMLVETAWRWSGNECWSMPVVEGRSRYSFQSTNSPLWELTQQFFNYNLQGRIIIPVL
ncbi:hypothetical protein [Nostoc sp.]